MSASRERETERQRHTDRGRETNRWRERETQIERDKQIERKRQDRETQTERDRQTYGERETESEGERELLLFTDLLHYFTSALEMQRANIRLDNPPPPPPDIEAKSEKGRSPSHRKCSSRADSTVLMQPPLKCLSSPGALPVLHEILYSCSAALVVCHNNNKKYYNYNNNITLYITNSFQIYLGDEVLLHE